MSLISLKNVSKFYYSKGVIASGFTKINLELNDGEFVAITGESGSGKSTLLNVISGLDSYEEGEMYINGLETSHYTEKDFEDYRRKYIGNIFQNFNLVNSYTVYQNIELVLLLNGYKKQEVKEKIIDLIKKVGLYKWKNQKVSKLSGGQKQRVAIARALAKETPIIIADEPTGNLDTKSAKEVLKLLSEIAKEKLVIVVTHNYEQIEEYVTRKITMNDGRITEDKEIKKVSKTSAIIESNYKNISNLNKLRLGIRNTFNIKVKFLLLLFIFFFSIFSLAIEYGSFKSDEQISNDLGYNNFLVSTNAKKIILSKKDKSIFTEEDYKKLNNNKYITDVYKNDLLTDSLITLNKSESYINGAINNIENFKGKVTYGRMPEKPFEVLIDACEEDYYLSENTDQILNKQFKIENYTAGVEYDDHKVTVVGIRYHSSAENFDNIIYGESEFIKFWENQLYNKYSKTSININGVNYKNEQNSNNFNVQSSPYVKVGEVILPQSYNTYCNDLNCINQNIKIKVSNIYYNDEKDLKVVDTYNQNNFKNLLKLKSFENNNGTIYISENDYNNLYNKGYYQASVLINDTNNLSKLKKDLNSYGFNILSVRDILDTDGITEIIQIFKTAITIIFIVILFLISYFVTKIILKSRNTYFSTIRMLGATKKICKTILSIEMITISILSYMVFILLIILNNMNITNIAQINNIYKFLTIKDYILLFLILVCMGYLVSLKFAKKLFKKTAISSLKEED